ncbi:MAG: pyridoxal-phosphate dependent enzyme [Spirochaetes bacterium]|nr:pyridoxal-phosphate dependent enzyme [Spirochaetota bacterium]
MSDTDSGTAGEERTLGGTFPEETAPEETAPEEPVENNLLDGAQADTSELLLDTEGQKRIAASSAYPLEQRLEAFENIVESQVGDTGMNRARNIEREVGLHQLYLKFEGGNPTGTQKDRIAFAQAADALRRGFEAITVATCGNYGVAISLATYLAGIRAIIYIPEQYHTRRTEEISLFGATIERVPGGYEEAVAVSKRRAKDDELYDANPGGENTAIQLKAYGEIAYEIYDELGDAPAVVALPVSNGTTLAGVYRGFIGLYRRGKTSRIPKLVAGSSFKKNPIIGAYIKNLPRCEDLKADQIRETKVNEPLINWHSIDGDHSLEAIRTSGGFAAYVTDRNMTDFSRILREREGLSVLPASTAGLIALVNRHKEQPQPSDRYVAILTGRK